MNTTNFCCRRRFFVPFVGTAALAAVLLGSTTYAQFEEEEDPLGAEAAAPADAPAAEAATAATVNPALVDVARRNPVVGAALGLPRETPGQKMRTVVRLLDLGHADVAAMVLPELLAEPLDDAGRAALVREFGSARFLALIRLDRPGAEGEQNLFAGAGEFAQKCLDAAAAEARDPQRLAAIIAHLNAPTEEERYAARVDLRATGEAGIVAAFAALAGAKDKNERANLLAGLADMRPAVDEPTVAVLAEATGQLRRDAAELAGHLRLGAALPWLAALAASSADQEVASAAAAALTSLRIPLPSPAEAQELVRRRLDALVQQPVSPADENIKDSWWSLDPASQQLSKAEFLPQQLRTLAIARLSRALAEAGGTVAEGDRRTALVRAWEEAALLGRDLSEPYKQWVGEFSPAELSAALGEAVDGRHFAAASQLAAELGRRGDGSILATGDGRPSPLAATVASPIRELRYAALASVMQLAPARSFPGASFVPEALWHFAAGAGEPTAVVAGPRFTRASDWAGQLRALGYQATPAGTGRDALLLALNPTTSARLALVVLDSDIGQPLLGEVLYQLRARERTAGVPVLILASVPRFANAQRLAARDPLVLASPRPQGPEAFQELAAEAAALSRQTAMTPERRGEQAAQALKWIAQLLAAKGPYDELIRDAAVAGQTLFDPALATSSLEVLALVGTADSQAALADYASAMTLPIEGRRQAVAALATSFERYGIQLNSEQLLRQYDRYNASETADAETQQVLGEVLDLLEKKKAAAVVTGAATSTPKVEAVAPPVGVSQ